MTKLLRRLLVLWGGAVVLSLVLLAVDGWFTRPQKFLWLIPYPTDLRTGWMIFAASFRSQPLLVTAIVVLPAVTVIGTGILVVAQAVASLVRRRHAA